MPLTENVALLIVQLFFCMSQCHSFLPDIVSTSLKVHYLVIQEASGVSGAGNCHVQDVKTLSVIMCGIYTRD
jgi:hypothetical protein